MTDHTKAILLIALMIAAAAALYVVAILGLRAFCRWAYERNAVETWTNAFVVGSADVADLEIAVERRVLIEQTESALDECLEIVKAWRS